MGCWELEPPRGFSSPTAANSRSRHQPTYSRKKRGSACGKLFSKEEEQEQSSQETKQQQLAEEFAKEKEEYYLLLANAENPLPQDWSIQTEEVQNGYEMDKRAAPAMREMIQAAKEDGVELMLCSAYRSVENSSSCSTARSRHTWHRG